MRGRKPKPTAIKILEGNPGKRPLNDNEPVPTGEIPECPTWLLPAAKKEWERVAPILQELGLLTSVDVKVFAAYCQSSARYEQAEAEINELMIENDKGVLRPDPLITVAHTYMKKMIEAGSLLGLNPSARSRLSVDKRKSEDDDMEDLLSGDD